MADHTKQPAGVAAAVVAVRPGAPAPEGSPPEVMPAVPSLTTAVSVGSVPQIQRRLVVTIGGSGAGAVTVPHGFGSQPGVCELGISYAAAGPAAGPTNIWLDTTAPHTSGFDATNVYLYVSGPGVVELYVG